MKCFIFVFISLLLICYAFSYGKCNCYEEAENDQHDTLVIFDLSINVTPKNFFDVSIKRFIQLIMEYCTHFKYTTIGDNLSSSYDRPNDDGNVTIKECDGSFNCELDILNLDYNAMTSVYPGTLNDENPLDSKLFFQFLNKTFTEIVHCKKNAVLLLTNRIISVEPYSQELSNVLANLNINFQTILLGRNEANATKLLHDAYRNVSNVKTQNFPNYDCLSYLFYCLLPCSSDTPECLKPDVDDCQISAKTPNLFPKETLHIWYVFDLAHISGNLGPTIPSFNIRKNLKKYMDTNKIKRVRIRILALNANGGISISNFEDVDKLYFIDLYTYTFTDPVVAYDQNQANNMLSFLPWSNTLTSTRIGMLSINIFTNYATRSLKTTLNGQSLEASMFVFDPTAYNYYLGILKNDTNFHIFNVGYDDLVPVLVIQNYSPISSSPSPSITSSTFIPSTCPSSCENKLSKILISENSKFESKSGYCETLIIFDLSATILTKDIFEYSVKHFLNLTLLHCGGFKFVIIDDNFGECEEGVKDCNITINDCYDLNECEKTIYNLDYNKITSSYPNKLFENSNETTRNYLKFLKNSVSKLCSCQENHILLLTGRIISLYGDPELSQIILNSCIKFTTILLGKDEINAAELLKLVYQSIPDAEALSLPNFDCLSNLFYCLLPCSSDTSKCLQSDLDSCQIPISTPNYYPDETLNLWCVYAFNSPFSNASFYQILDNLKNGINKYTEANDIKNIRITVVNYDHSFITYSDVESLNHLFVWQIQENGDVIDDTYELNERLSLIPWSGTLFPSRPGILSVIVLTNYASIVLQTFVDGQALQGSMYVYNAKAFEYYSQQLENNTNFNLFNSNYQDSIIITPIHNAAPTSAPSLSSISTKASIETSATTNKITEISYPLTQLTDAATSSQFTDAATTSTFSISKNMSAFTMMPYMTYFFVNVFFTLLFFQFFNEI